MIPRPVEAHEHVPVVDLERSSGPWIPTEFPSIYVQLLLLCAVLLLFVFLHVLRYLRFSRADAGSSLPSCGLIVGDKEFCQPQKEYQLSEKSAPQSLSAAAPGRGWWWVDALLGRDAEEEDVASGAHRQLDRPVQNDPELQGYKDSIPYNQPRQQRPPISMAKLIMSRHVRSSHIPFDISVTDLSCHFFLPMHNRLNRLDDHGHRLNLRRRLRRRHSHTHDPPPDSPRLACKSYDYAGALELGPSCHKGALWIYAQYPSLICFRACFCPRGDCYPFGRALQYSFVDCSPLTITYSFSYSPHHFRTCIYSRPELFFVNTIDHNSTDPVAVTLISFNCFSCGQLDACLFVTQ